MHQILLSRYFRGELQQRIWGRGLSWEDPIGSCLVTSPLPWLWTETQLCRRHLRGCTCQRHPLPCQMQGPPSCTSWWVFNGFHLLAQVMRLHKVTQVGIVLRQGPVCAIPVVTDPRSFSSVMHTYSVAFSPFSDIMVQFLDFLKEASATPLFLQLHHFLSVFSLLLRLVKRIFSRGLQSPIITVHAVRPVNIAGDPDPVL